MSDLYIVTVATESQYYFPYLIDTCRKYGKEIDILGFGEKWQGFNWRMQLMIDYLKNKQSSDVICFIDGYDVICTRDLNELKDEFIKLYIERKCKIVVGYDNIKHGNFINNFYVENYSGKCKNLSLNAGTYIGFASDLLNMLIEIQSIDNNKTSDDQVLLTKYCKQNEDLFHIDSNNKLFLTIDNPLHEIDNLIDIDEQGGISYNQNRPFFLHGPGATFLDNVLIKIGYDDPRIKDIIRYKYPAINNVLNMIINGNTMIFLCFFSIFCLVLAFFLFRRLTAKDEKNKMH